MYDHFIHVPVRFEGVVRVRVNPDLEEEDAQALARGVALSRIIATLDNPDAPADQAFEEWHPTMTPWENREKLAAILWDQAYETCEMEAGTWRIPIAEVYTHSCPETNRVFICEYDKDDNLAEVFPHDGLTAWEVGEKILTSVSIGGRPITPKEVSP